MKRANLATQAQTLFEQASRLLKISFNMRDGP